MLFIIPSLNSEGKKGRRAKKGRRERLEGEQASLDFKQGNILNEQYL
jgi:hypothetical protein